LKHQGICVKLGIVILTATDAVGKSRNFHHLLAILLIVEL